MLRAGFVVYNNKLRPEIFSHMVRRILDDFTVRSVTVFTFRSLVDYYASLAEAVFQDQSVTVVDAASLNGGDLDVVFFQHPPTRPYRAMEAGEIVPAPRMSVALPDHLPRVEMNYLGRTALQNVAKQTPDHGGNIFASNFDDSVRFEDALGYYPFFLLFKNSAEVGALPFSRYEQDEFGFRVEKGDRPLERRGDELLVVMHGGSAAYGVFNSVPRSCGGQLQSFLQAGLVERGDRRAVRVVNMAIPGSTLSDCMARHVLLAHRMRPDYVVAHIGWNETTSLLYTDPSSARRGIFIQDQQVKIGQMFWQSQGRWGDEIRTLSFDHDLSAENIADLVLERLGQFARMVGGDGGKLVAAIQPTIFSKSALHILERGYFTRKLLRKRDPFDRMVLLQDSMDAMEDGLHTIDGPCLSVGFNRLLRQEDGERFMFWDTCHTAPPGDGFMARVYADRILDDLAGRET